MKHNYRWIGIVLLVLASMIVNACAQPTPVIVEKEKVVEKPVFQTVVVEKEKVVKETVVVEKEVVVTPTPEPVPTVVKAEKPVYGGTLRIASSSDFPSMDLPVSWDSASWAVELMIFNGLMRFQRSSAETEPELAESYSVSDDGLIWTFKVREGLTFSDGSPLTAHDVKYSVDRNFSPDVGGWGTAYYMAIEGTAERMAGEADEVIGVKVVDDYTIEFHLTSPVPYFDKLMAMPWTYAMKKEHVEKYADDVSHRPLGSGPFMLEEWIPGQRAIFVKNPNYFRDDEPYVDKVIWEIGVEPEVALLRLEKGELDLMEDRVPASEYPRLIADPKWQPYIIEEAGNDTYYMTVNYNQEPLRHLKVRQAIAHAIDKEKMVRLIGGRGEPAKGLFAANNPAYNPDIPYYEYNPEKAKELLAEAGYPDGFKMDAWDYNVYPYPEMGQAIQHDLGAIGIDVHLHLLSRAAWFEANAQPENGLGFNSWSLELPDPSYIVDGGFSCAAMYPNSCCNFSWYCNAEFDAKLDAARSELDPEKRIEMYKEIDKHVTYDEVLWVPLYYPKWSFIYSPKVGGFEMPRVLAWTHQFYRYWSVTGE